MGVKPTKARRAELRTNREAVREDLNIGDANVGRISTRRLANDFDFRNTGRGSRANPGPRTVTRATRDLVATTAIRPPRRRARRA